ncbi:uncharacterized protein LOC129773674 [Toxorhynchites rutilus septentrionalis]|uniref:uncharacterized protein LOC129773674 n=1 Tax=Toxorhynchites rutilus septentrionalis TaxID=329112 RepID=UPI00247AC784|nr:uncharacterized protein LOC129773674 [Toxorhynchites rutilus septentrionalis]
MYRQVRVHKLDRTLQQIFWRKSQSESLKTYQLKTVTYGTACAPFLATRCLNQLADDEQYHFPLAARLLKKSFYVDDCLAGDDDKDRTIESCKQLIQLLASGNFLLRKWSSNDSEILSHIPEYLRDNRDDLEIDKSSSVKTLGLIWHPLFDSFGFKVPLLSPSIPITKRIALSEMSRLFDPMGLVGAVIVSAKIYLQSLWSNSFTWDEELPLGYQNWWETFRNEIQVLSTLKITRRVLIDQFVQLELHCFADASEKAYGCCLYVKSIDKGGNVACNLLISKSKASRYRNSQLHDLNCVQLSWLLN